MVLSSGNLPERLFRAKRNMAHTQERMGKGVQGMSQHTTETEYGKTSTDTSPSGRSRLRRLINALTVLAVIAIPLVQFLQRRLPRPLAIVIAFLLVDDRPRSHQSVCGRLRAHAAIVHPVAHCFEHECRRGYPSLYTDSDKHSYAFPMMMLTRKAGQAHGANMTACFRLLAPALFERTWLTRKISRISPRFSSHDPIKL
jgi:hypothetical protein